MQVPLQDLVLARLILGSLEGTGNGLWLSEADDAKDRLGLDKDMSDDVGIGDTPGLAEGYKRKWVR